jgi:hypothetical protein
MRIQNKLKLASILFLLVSFVCAAQETGDPPPPMPPPPPGLPIDGGLLVLLVFGVLLGAYYRTMFSQSNKPLKN